MNNIKSTTFKEFTDILHIIKRAFNLGNNIIVSNAARIPNAISLDASEKERLLELRYTLIILIAHTNSERAC